MVARLVQDSRGLLVNRLVQTRINELMNALLEEIQAPKSSQQYISYLDRTYKTFKVVR